MELSVAYKGIPGPPRGPREERKLIVDLQERTILNLRLRLWASEQREKKGT